MSNSIFLSVNRFTVWLRLTSFLTLSLSLSALAEDVLIVDDGSARGEIVVAEDPARLTRLAAEELQTYIEKVSGARLPIVTEPSADAVPIYVGISRHTDELGLTTDGLKYGAFRMDSGPDWLALLGADQDYEPVEPWSRSRDRREIQRVDQAWDEITGDVFRNPFWTHYMYYNEELDYWHFDDRGTLNAVHQFLRDLGVRWYFPGELGEIVPDLKTIGFESAMSEMVVPDFPLRSMKWWSRHHGATEDEARWRLRLGLHLGHDIVGVTQDCHGMKFSHGREEIRESRPDLFAVFNGQPDTTHKRHGRPCLSNPEVFDRHVAYARAVFDTFDEPLISIDVVDGFGGSPCECEDCQDLDLGTPERGSYGAMSDYVWGYVNRVAEELYKSHPDRLVSGIAYGAYRYPPLNIDKMSPNLVIILMTPRFTFDDVEKRQAFEQLMVDWQEKLANDRFVVFENFSYNRDDNHMGVPVYYTRQNAEFLRTFGDDFLGFLTGIYGRHPLKRDDYEWNELATAHLDIYSQSRLWWDVETDVDALLDEYCRLFFGPAHEEMRAFIDYSEANLQGIRSDPKQIDRTLELLAAAQAAVDPDTVYGERVQLIADYVEPIALLRDKLTQEREGPQIRLARRPADELKMDGNLDDVFWQGVPAIELVDPVSGESPAIRTTVQIAWADNDSLIIGVRSDEPDMESIFYAADGGMGIFNGDNIDILLEVPGHNFYQFVIDPAGELLDMDRSNKSANGRFHYGWVSGVTVATHHGADHWTMEIQLPAAGIDAFELDANFGISGQTPKDGAPWYLNMGRLRPRSGVMHFSSLVSPGAGRRFDDRWIRAALTVE